MIVHIEQDGNRYKSQIVPKDIQYLINITIRLRYEKDEVKKREMLKKLEWNLGTIKKSIEFFEEDRWIDEMLEEEIRCGYGIGRD